MKSITSARGPPPATLVIQILDDITRERRRRMELPILEIVLHVALIFLLLLKLMGN